MKAQNLPVLIFFLLISIGCKKQSEVKNQNNASMIIADNLSNQRITCFGEDEFGYIWIGTNRGVNKYNGYNFRQFFHTEDSLSLSSNQSQQIFSDSRGRLWVTTVYGINLHNKQGVFMRIPVESNSQNITQIKESDDKRLFVNTVLDICEYDTELNRFIKRISFSSESAAVNGFHLDDLGRLWCIGRSSVVCYDSKSFTVLSSFSVPKTIHYSFLGKNGKLWLAAGNELLVLDTRSETFVAPPAVLREHKTLSEAIFTMVYPYDDTSLLINTQKDGLFLYNTYNGKILHQSDRDFPFKTPQSEITVIYRDKNKNLWVGSYDQGFLVHYEYKQRFNSNDYLSTQLAGQSVISTAVDKEQNLWIVTYSDGLKVWNQSSQKLERINLDHFFPEDTFYQDRVKSIFIDSRNNIWLQTTIKLLRCRFIKGQLIRDKTYHPGVPINCMTEDQTGRIWAAGGQEYLFQLDEEDEFQRMSLYPKSFIFTNGLLTLSTGKLLIASFAQTLRLFDPETKEMEEINILPHITSGVFIPSVAYEDSRGDLWIGTIGSGLFRYSFASKKMESIKKLPCQEVSSLIEDAQGNLWIGTLYGLGKYDYTTQQVTSYYKSDGIGGNQFNERSACRLSNKSIVFGGTHGITVFDPLDITRQSKIPLFIEELRIHNHFVSPEKNGVIETEMILNPQINLAYNQNSIQISYAALDYSEYQRVKYAYKLQGFDSYWVEANTYRQAFYSNLPAGNYTFQVKSMSSDNSVEEMVVSLPVHVSRAPWFSIPMLIVYLFVVLGIIFYILFLYKRIQINRQRTRQAVYEKEQEQRINQMNMSFFANISHEFRTPLTMIVGPVRQLFNGPGINHEEKNLLVIIQRNVDRMLRLINQLMDFNKLENDTLSLRVEYIEVTGLVKTELDTFRINAEEKQITLVTHGLQNPFHMWVDTDMLQKIISNLLSNALKFSRSGGVIDVHFDVISRSQAANYYPLTVEDTDREYVQIRISDTGIGIPEDQLETIFKRYYQVTNNDKGNINWGTGIGLYYSRRLAEMHHGYIKASNRPEGGAVFSFILPANMESYTNPEREILNTNNATTEHAQYTLPLLRTENEKLIEKEKNTLLVVDDDTEISHYLRILLSSNYHVVSAFDACKAWEMIEEVEPDLIISDVLMPGMDGFSFCSKIKENISTCHIPVILLTAKVTIHDQVEGLNVGANAYVTKPFDPSYLMALVKSQIKNRDFARKLLADSTKSNSFSEDILNTQDIEFMDSLYNLMETELSNPELNITRMTEVLHISRTKFYYKVKGLTGENPNVFFKTYKLNRAAELIKGGKCTMAEIADLTGFTTPSHFSASFKKKFGVPPSEFS